MIYIIIIMIICAYKKCNCMRAAGLINNGKFNYGAFNGIAKYRQDALIALYKYFSERYSGLKFTLSDKSFRVLNGAD